MRARSGLVGLALLSLSACGQNESHPKPGNFSCDGGSCISPGGGGGGGGKDAGTGGGSSGGAAGSPSDAAVDAGGVDVSGKLVLYGGDNFATSAAYTQGATIIMDGPGGAPVQGNYDGTSFDVQGVASGASVWARVLPQGATEMVTLQRVDTQASQSLSLNVVAWATLQVISAAASKPSPLQAGAAHVVVHFVDTAGNAMPGVALSHDGEKVSYDLGASFSDTAAGTGSQGYAVMFNVAATSTVSQASFDYTTPTTNGSVTLEIMGDAVTFVTVAP